MQYNGPFDYDYYWIGLDKIEPHFYRLNQYTYNGKVFDSLFIYVPDSNFKLS